VTGAPNCRITRRWNILSV